MKHNLLGLAFLIVTFIATSANGNSANGNNALEFDGVDDYVETTSLAIDTIADGDFTFEAWIKGDEMNMGNHPTIFGNRIIESQGMVFFFHNVWGTSSVKMLAVQLDGANYFIENNGTLNASLLDDSCHHVAITRENSLLSFYADGALFGTVQIFNGNPNIATGTNLRIGSDISRGFPFQGVISDTRIWGVARSASDISGSMNAYLTSPLFGLLAHWEMNEGSGQLVMETVSGADGQLGSNSGVDGNDPTWSSEGCKFPLSSPPPVITSFVADDPDDLDTVYSFDDTLTITFDSDTNMPGGTKRQRKLAIDDLFTFTESLGNAHSGRWTAPDTFTITIKSVNNAGPPVIGSTTVTPAGITPILSVDETSVPSSAISPILSGDFGTPIPAKATACVTPPADLIAWWPLEETTGTLVHDLTGNHNGIAIPGPINSNGPTSVSGYVGNAFHFDGNVVVEVPHDNALSFGTGDFTIETWVQRLGTIVSKYDPATGSGYKFWTDTASGAADFVFFELWSNYSLVGDINHSDSPGSFQGWHHWAVAVERGTAISLYLDGQFIWQEPITNTTADIGNVVPLLIGDSSSYENSIDELEIYARALSAAEIEGIYLADADGKCKDGIYDPWDAPFCEMETSIVVNTEVCNYSTTSHNYKLSFSQVLQAACPAWMPIDGPTSFADATTSSPIPPPVAITVPAQTCQSVPIQIDRPSGMNTAKQVGCYTADLTNLDTGAFISTMSSVQDRSDICAVGLLDDSPILLRVGQSLPLGFTLNNTSGQELTFDYTIEAVPSDMNPDRNALALNGLATGESVTGSMTLPVDGQSSLSVDVTFDRPDPFGFQDLIVYTRMLGEEYVPLVSQSFRNPLPAENSFALNFDGGSDGGEDYVEITDTTALNAIGAGDFTFEAWYNAVEVEQTAHPAIMSNRPSQSVGFMFGFHTIWGGSPYKIPFVRLGEWNYIWTAPPELLDGTWHHFAARKAGDTLTYFADGQEIQQFTSVNIQNDTIAADHPLWIGFDDEHSDTPWNGLLDEVRIWNSARTETEIQADMHRKLTRAEPGLVASWSMDEGTGQATADATGIHTGQFGSTTGVDTNDPQWTETLFPYK